MFSKKNALHHPKKYLGQHFLNDESVIQKIVDIISPKQGQRVVEIGPGLGALTKKLLPLVGAMDVIELDQDVLPKLSKACAHLGELNIYASDVLQFDFSSLYKNNQPLRIVGNLPYQISTPLLFYLIPYTDMIVDMHFMLQKEVVDRMAGQVGTKAYGRLSIMLQYHFQVTSLFMVCPEAFDPPPKVTSAVVRLVPQKMLVAAKNYELFSQVVRQAFNYRRKTLHNALKGLVTDAQMISVGIDPTSRPEEVSVEEFVQMSNAMQKID